MWRLRACCLAFVVMLCGCADRGPAPEGQVFAGPLNLPLHQDYNPKSKVVAQVHHGDPLDVLEQRRRLYRVRGPHGETGWTDERNLMSVDQMSELRRLEQRARELPTQGVASTYDPLNVHTAAQRYSPSFFQIPPGEKFDVIAHDITARVEPQHRVLFERPKPQPRPRKPDKRRLSLPPPPAPKLPPNWEELSKMRELKTPPQPETKQKGPPAEPAPTDDWTLIRTPKGSAGWVLTNRIYLAIPDEVAQYAEGHRIVAYFPIGGVHDTDRDVNKNYWLWTTVHAGVHAYDFDSYRVFTWNPKKHRYETAYIQRDIEGFLPVLVNKADGSVTFSLCLAAEEGGRIKKEYTMIEHTVKLVNVERCDESKPEAQPPQQAQPATEKKPQSVTQKLEDKLGDVKSKLFGKK